MCAQGCVALACVRALSHWLVMSTLLLAARAWTAWHHPRPQVATGACGSSETACQGASFEQVPAQEDFQSCWAADGKGLIPLQAGWELQGMAAADSPTLGAYASTSPSLWGKNCTHYCCESHDLGCAPSAA